MYRKLLQCLVLLLFLCSTVKVNAQQFGADTTRKNSEAFPPAPFPTPPGPYYAGGDDEMKAFISRNIVYPPEARQKKIQGTVVLALKINTDGRLKNITVISGHRLLAAEAKRVIALLPEKWIPAKDKHGKTVEGRYTLPLSFNL